MYGQDILSDISIEGHFFQISYKISYPYIYGILFM